MSVQAEHTFSANGLTLWYIISGSGPICLLPTPGWGVSSDIYFHTLTGLEQFLTVVYLDTRGSGRSQRPPTPNDYTYDLFAADLDALRQHLGQERVLVMGHSQAGVHAMYYALHYPERCAGLVLLDTLPAFDDHYQEDMHANITARQDEPWFEEAYAAFTREDQLQSDEDFGRYLMDIIPFYLVDQEAANRYEEAFAATTFSLAAIKGQEAVQLEINLLPDLHRITCQALLAVGSEDFICSPLQSERIHMRIANSKLIVIQNAGHFPWLERPLEFFPRLKAGLQSLGLLEDLP
jgi:proline iminopeptidase